MTKGPGRARVLAGATQMIRRPGVVWPSGASSSRARLPQALSLSIVCFHCCFMRRGSMF